ncbi:MAG TPA: leucyl aminopeptidase family protein, partial [Devosia sp.]|nr:leucyl aminopeptidase family protein [Devosia sp.]
MAKPASLPLIFIGDNGLAGAGLDPLALAWATANGFTGQRGRLLAVPDGQGGVSAQLFGTGAQNDRPLLVAGLAGAQLAAGQYRLEGDYGDPTLAALAFNLGVYRFTRYRSGQSAPTLLAPTKADPAEIARLTAAAYLARDLINTAPNDLGPDA